MAEQVKMGRGRKNSSSPKSVAKIQHTERKKLPSSSSAITAKHSPQHRGTNHKLQLATKLVQKSCFVPTAKRRQNGNRHAQQATFEDYTAITIGKEIQVYQAIVKLHGKIFKHFQTCDRCSKFVYTDVSATPKD